MLGLGPGESSLHSLAGPPGPSSNPGPARVGDQLVRRARQSSHSSRRSAVCRHNPKLGLHMLRQERRRQWGLRSTTSCPLLSSRQKGQGPHLLAVRAGEVVSGGLQVMVQRFRCGVLVDAFDTPKRGGAER